MNSAAPVVSIIIVNWNGREHLKNCLKKVFGIDFRSFEVILVDNGSKDGSRFMVSQSFPAVKIINNERDLGFCLANNIGFKHAKGKYVLFLNNDTEVTQNFLSLLVEVLETKPEICVVQPKIIFLKTKKLQAGGAFFTATGFLYHFGYAKDPEGIKYNSSRALYSANGSCMLVRKKTIDKMGLFDEDYFSYFEETDFCHRVLLSGKKILYWPKAIIYHIGLADNKKHKRSELLYNSYRNRINSYIKNLEWVNLTKILFWHFWLCAASVFGFFLLREWDNVKAVIDAIVWNVRNLPKTLVKRKHIQENIRKVKDCEYLPEVTVNPPLIYYYYLFKGLDKYND